VMATNVGAGALAARIGARRTIALGAILAAAGCAGLLGVGADTSYPAMAAQLVAVGAGVGLVVPLMTSELLGSVDRSRSGLASGTLNTMRQTGSVIGVALLGSLAGDLTAVLAIAGALFVAPAILAAVME
jgi:MFS transporter, DHA2 family, methylenomycin A resistance protein